MNLRRVAHGLLALAVGLAANSLLGPLAAEVIEYRFSDTLVNQGIGLDAVALLGAVPQAVVAAVLVRRGHPAGPVLGFIPSTFAAYMAPQYIVGPYWDSRQQRAVLRVPPRPVHPRRHGSRRLLEPYRPSPTTPGDSKSASRSKLIHRQIDRSRIRILHLSSSDPRRHQMDRAAPMLRWRAASVKQYGWWGGGRRPCLAAVSASQVFTMAMWVNA